MGAGARVGSSFLPRFLMVYFISIIFALVVDFWDRAIVQIPLNVARAVLVIVASKCIRNNVHAPGKASCFFLSVAACWIVFGFAPHGWIALAISIASDGLPFAAQGDMDGITGIHIRTFRRLGHPSIPHPSMNVGCLSMTFVQIWRMRVTTWVLQP